MSNDVRWFAAVLVAGAAILAYQLLIPPVVGLADQGDFLRTIGRFGYGPQHLGELEYAFVEPKYVPDGRYRNPNWEQANSEYLFVGAALLLNKAISKDGTLDITVAGIVHGLAFLAAFGRLLWVTRHARARAVLWIGALGALTDAGYAVYFNSWYAEPASCIFFLLLLAEAVDVSQAGTVSLPGILRWSLWGILWVLAKPQNAPIGLIVGLFSLRLGMWTPSRLVRSAAVAGALGMFACTAFDVFAMPVYGRQANTYGMIFSGILTESKDREADLRALDLDPQLARYAGSGAWSPVTAFPEMAASGALKRVHTFSVVRFYVLRPARMWRRLHSALPGLTSLHLRGYGNFEPSAGLPPKTLSRAFTIWGDIHENVLSPCSKWILFALAGCPFWAGWRWIRLPEPLERRRLEILTLLPVCTLAALCSAVYGDAFDTVKHLYLFNQLLDCCLLLTAASLIGAFLRRRTKGPGARPT